ncbi:MAG: pseudouridine synthase [Anaerolineae bacterium]|nr:pseudouridine synthase [Anaerolineae bacterium]
MKIRLQKILAQANAATSRRAAEELIERGRVFINGDKAHLGDKADPEVDVITVDGARLKLDLGKKIFIALNKPKHVLTTREPHQGDRRPTVYDLIDVSENLFPIGRLDADSEGLIVLTNDGAAAQRLTHPRYQHSKTYKVEVVGLPGLDVLDKWRNGLILDEDEHTSPCIVTLLQGDNRLSTLRIIMAEGKKRQIRRVGMKLGHQVRRLVRTHIGLLSLGELRPGEWKELTASEIKLLMTPAPELRRLKTARRSHPIGRRSAQGSDASARPMRRPRPDEADFEEDTPRPRRPHRESADFSDDAPRPRRPRPAGESRDEAPRPPRRPRPESADFSQDAPRPRRPRPAGESRDDAPRPPRHPRRDSADFSQDAPRPRRPRPAGESRSDDTQRPRRPRPAGESRSDDTQRPRRPRPDSADFSQDAPRPRRPRPAGESRDDAPRPPRHPRPDSADFSQDAPRPRRPRPAGESRDDAPHPPRRPRPAGGNQERDEDSRPQRRRAPDAPKGRPGRPSAPSTARRDEPSKPPRRKGPGSGSRPARGGRKKEE